jgi:hypothetical protein
MKMLFEIAAWGILAPAAISLAIVWIGRWLQARSGAEVDRAGFLHRTLAAVAFAVAFFVSYEIQRVWFSLAPAAYWRWIPYLALLGVFVGGLRLAERLSTFERWVALLLFAALVAWRSMPTWAHLALPEPLAPLGEALKKLNENSSGEKTGHQLGYILLFAVALVLIVSLVERAAKRTPPWQFAAALAATSGVLAALVSYAFSLKFGQVALASAAAAGGVSAGCFIVGRRAGGQPPEVRGMTAAWSASVAAIVFAAYLNSTSRPLGLLLFPLAPIALWIPNGRMVGWPAAALRFTLLGAALAACAALVLWKASPD